MILLDEQVREDQRGLLSGWGIHFRQIGREIAASGTQDADIIPWLHSLKRSTFFTHDRWFFQRRLCHTAYCLIWLDVKDIEAAGFIRRFLRHPEFLTHKDRLGRVIRLHHEGIEFWVRATSRSTKVAWPS